jgi:hypothetical protein
VACNIVDPLSASSLLTNGADRRLANGDGMGPLEVLARAVVAGAASTDDAGAAIANMIGAAASPEDAAAALAIDWSGKGDKTREAVEDAVERQRKLLDEERRKK